MDFFAEGRLSDLPQVEAVWRGQAGSDLAMMCQADGRWNLMFRRLGGKVRVSVEGPLSRAVPKRHEKEVDWLVIKLKLGIFLPHLRITDVLDNALHLPDAAHKSFWLHGSTWEAPTFENAETFVHHLIRDDALVCDPLVTAALQDQPLDAAPRTVRHRFSQVTGLAQTTVRQIERAHHASELLQRGFSILDVVYETGYADQPHLTRSFKRYIGETPTQIAARHLAIHA